MSLDDSIDEAVEDHRRGLDGIWRLIRTVQKDPALTDDERFGALSRLYSPLSYKDIRQNFVMDGNKFDIGVSFRSSVANMMRLKMRLRRHGYNIAPGGNNKMHDLAFARRLGVPAPRTFANGVQTSDLQLLPRTIIKPTQGANARGVFLIDEDLTIQSIKTGQRYYAIEDAVGEMPTSTQMLRWIVEEAVLDTDGKPAADMKLYMFYGFAGLYIEIDGRGEVGRAPRYTAYNSEGRVVDLNAVNRSVSGRGIPDDVLEYARILSVNSPVPFLRIDFLSGATGSYLGEITPHPGSTYAGDLYDDLDRVMGEYFLDAESRLLVDVFHGKSFNAYHEIYGSAPRR